MTEVICDPAGPPSGGLYLNPPSSGGLCDGVITIPSAWPWTWLRPPSALCIRMASDRDGVGVYPSRLSTSTVTSLAASTSSAVTKAGSDSACVSRPRYSGPVVPAAAR